MNGSIKHMKLNVPADLHRRFKMACMDAGTTMTEQIFALMDEFCSNKAMPDAPQKVTIDQRRAIGYAVTEAASAGIALDDLRLVCPDNFDAALAAFMDMGYGRIEDDRVYLVEGGV